MTKIWWVRHGPTHVKAMVGWSDVPADLSDTEALAKLDRYLPRLPVVSSDLVRAVDTASALQADRPRLAHEPSLKEMNFGDWELRPGNELYDEDPDGTRAFWDDPENNRPPGGESWRDLDARVRPTVERLIADHPDGLIVVAHFGVILSQVRHALAVPVPRVLAHRIDNLSVTQISYGPTRPYACAINHTP
ncbi:MAG TPA: histidine phosphatase family protein [Maritimibacter sp.]|nr:histidine phosphatase family protein [Maritimibacter sp.]